MFKRYFFKIIEEYNRKELLKKSDNEFEEKMRLRECGYVFDYNMYSIFKTYLKTEENHKLSDKANYLMKRLCDREDYLESQAYVDFKRLVESYLSLMVSDYLLGLQNKDHLTNIGLYNMHRIGLDNKYEDRFERYIQSNDIASFNNFLCKKYKRDILIKLRHDDISRWIIDIVIKDEF